MNLFDSNILFLGDSITAEFDVKKYLPDFKINNKAVSGDITTETLRLVNSSLFKSNPNFVFLCIGTNDLARERSVEFIVENILEIIKKVKTYSPESIIILTSIFPTRDNQVRPNKKIIEINKKIGKTGNIYGYIFFNLHQYFTDSNGLLKTEFTNDGLHLTHFAYKEWARRLKEFTKVIHK